MKKMKVVAIGGGTGSVSVLMGLKMHSNLNLSVIVCMSDDGGSNRIVRDEFGILPLSDIRKSLIALSGRGNGVFRELFTYRFDRGKGLEGHTLGNLIMMALTDIGGSEKKAVSYASDIFNVVGSIIPVTYDLVKLCAKYENGDIVIGESNIDSPVFDTNEKISKLFLKPEATANPKAIKAIKDADYIIIGPGDLYTSISTNFIVKGIQEAMNNTKAKIIIVMNLMSENGETRGMSAEDIVNEINKYSGRAPDYVVINNANFPGKVLKRYKKKGELPIEDDLGVKKEFKIIRADVLNRKQVKKQKGDNLERSFIRHDSDKLGDVLYKIIVYD